MGVVEFLIAERAILNPYEGSQALWVKDNKTVIKIRTLRNGGKNTRSVLLDTAEQMLIPNTQIRRDLLWKDQETLQRSINESGRPYLPPPQPASTGRTRWTTRGWRRRNWTDPATGNVVQVGLILQRAKNSRIKLDDGTEKVVPSTQIADIPNHYDNRWAHWNPNDLEELGNMEFEHEGEAG